MTILYVTDLDKTWLRSDLTISDYSRKVWNTLSTKGVRITFATARSYKKAKSLLDGLNLPQPCIVLNGAALIEDEKPFQIYELESKVVESLIELGELYGISPFILGMEGNNDIFGYSDARSSLEQSFLDDRNKDPRLQYRKQLHPIEHTLTVNFLGYADQIMKLLSQVKDKFGEKLEIKCAHDPYLQEAASLEVLHPKGDKKHALSVLAKRLGIPHSSVTVFGDNINDIGMGNLAGRCIAVRNAVNEFIKISDIILPHSNDEDGVAKFLAEEHNIIL